MDNFANIGKAILLQSIGLQKNYTEIEESTTEVIDYNTSACSSCKYKALLQAFSPNSEVYCSVSEICNNCPNKSFTTKTVYKKIYHNEKNRYAQKEYKPRLKTNAIKLFLLMHFCHPDRFGIIRSLDMRMLSKMLSCDIKTIHNNLEILKQYNYISYSKNDTYTITVFLTDYENYYLPANKGGRGFFVMSKELLLQLLAVPTLVTLRIYLRELVDIDNLNAKGSPFTAISKSYSDMKRALPDYCKPGIIKKALSLSSEIFSITFQNSSVRFEISEKYECKKQKEACFENYQKQFKEFVIDFNKVAGFLNVNNSAAPRYKEYFHSDDGIPVKNSSNLYRLIKFEDFQIEDLAMLALQYSYDTVIFALSSIYKSYILNDRKILNLGGLVRSVILSSLNNSYSAA